MMWSSNGKNKPSGIEQLLILQEKVPIIIKFKPQTFVLPTPKEFVLRKKNHPTSPPSNLGFPSFFPKKNSSSLSKTKPTSFFFFWRKETFSFYLFYLLLLPSSPPSPSRALISLSLQLSSAMLLRMTSPMLLKPKIELPSPEKPVMLLLSTSSIERNSPS